jgi:hypothetical protein
VTRLTSESDNKASVKEKEVQNVDDGDNESRSESATLSATSKHNESEGESKLTENLTRRKRKITRPNLDPY